MKGIFLASLVFLMPVLCRATEKKTRTMAELKTIALSQGEDDVIGAPISRDLGLGYRKISNKEVWIDGREIPSDGFIHTLSIITDKDFPQQDFEWSVYQETTTTNGKFIESYDFLVNKTGRLLAAAQGIGIVGDVKRRSLSLHEAQQRFKNEKNFWMKASSQYPWGK